MLMLFFLNFQTLNCYCYGFQTLCDSRVVLNFDNANIMKMKWLKSKVYH